MAELRITTEDRNKCIVPISEKLGQSLMDWTSNLNPRDFERFYLLVDTLDRVLVEIDDTIIEVRMD